MSSTHVRYFARIQPNGQYYDVVDLTGAAPVIRASYCTKEEAELFASAPTMKARLAYLEPLFAEQNIGLIGRFFNWLTRGWYARVILRVSDIAKERG